MNLKVALLQVQSQNNLEHNFKSCEVLAKSAKADGAEFLLLPENFSFLGNEDEKIRLSAEIETQTQEFLKNLATDLDLWVLGGGFAVASRVSHKVYNQASLVNPKGQTVAAYQKIHLFDVALPQVQLQESKNTTPGESLITAALREWTVGLSICYDVRFPELYRALSHQGANILTVPAAFTVPTGAAHWHTLLRARAIENQCYVLAPAQTGQHSATRASFGHSLVIDPWGDILADAGEEVGYVMADLDWQRLQDVRKNMPVLAHKRL